MTGEEPSADRPRSICEPCWEGDHSNHKPALAGICIGCTCDVSGAASERRRGE